MKKENPSKELYQRLRRLSCEQLWSTEVTAFDRADRPGRLQNVAVVRAVGVVFSESGTPDEQERARAWLRALLRDPEEKVRRYAMNALPKLGGASGEEGELLSLLETTSSEREKYSLARTLEKIGGSETLGTAEGRLAPQILRKVAANVARVENPSRVRMDGALGDFAGLNIHLHCREGLEEIVAAEVDQRVREGAPFRRVRCSEGLVTVTPRGPFTLGDLFALRCFGYLGIEPGKVSSASPDEVENLAAVLASPDTLRVLEAFTEGPLRYRLEFVSKGHQRSTVRRLGDRVYALNPALLNDSRDAPWQINVRHHSRGCSLEVTPRLRPDPRFAYRLGDVPAASHPPLAACLARIAGKVSEEIVWDPFCGSGLELIERSLLGGVVRVFGTDLSAGALEMAGLNLAEAVADVPVTLACCDFRDHASVEGLGVNSVSLVVTNPPLGRRVPISDLPGLIYSLFTAAVRVLRPGGRLVFVNPTSAHPGGLPLRQDDRRRIDLGGFHCHLERYTKVG